MPPAPPSPRASPRLTDARDAVGEHTIHHRGSKVPDCRHHIDRLRAPPSIDCREHSRDAPILKGIGAILKGRAGERQLLGASPPRRPRGPRCVARDEGQQRLFAEAAHGDCWRTRTGSSPQEPRSPHRAMKRELGEQLAASAVFAMNLVRPAVALFGTCSTVMNKPPRRLPRRAQHLGHRPRATHSTSRRYSWSPSCEPAADGSASAGSASPVPPASQ